MTWRSAITAVAAIDCARPPPKHVVSAAASRSHLHEMPSLRPELFLPTIPASPCPAGLGQL